MPDPSPTPALDALVREIDNDFISLDGDLMREETAAAIRAALPSILRERIAGLVRDIKWSGFPEHENGLHSKVGRFHVAVFTGGHFRIYLCGAYAIAERNADWSVEETQQHCLAALADLLAATMGGE